MQKLKQRVALCLLGGVVMAMALVGPAFAAGDTDTGAAVTTATGTLTDTIHAGIPLILGVAAVWVVLSLGKKLVKKAG